MRWQYDNISYAKKLTAKKQDETLVSQEEFMASLDRGEEEYRQGEMCQATAWGICFRNAKEERAYRSLRKLH